MITQAIKEWFRKVFAWWPWKQSPFIEYEHVTSATARGSTPETTLRASKEETVPQAGVTPRRFPLENRRERLIQPRSETPGVPPLSPPASFPSTDTEPENAPMVRQRLEFLRYLIRRGIVNEGFENNPPDPSD